MGLSPGLQRFIGVLLDVPEAQLLELGLVPREDVVEVEQELLVGLFEGEEHVASLGPIPRRHLIAEDVRGALQTHTLLDAASADWTGTSDHWSPRTSLGTRPDAATLDLEEHEGDGPKDDGTGEEPSDEKRDDDEPPADEPEVTGEGLDEEPLPEPAEDGTLPDGVPAPPDLPPEDTNPDGSFPSGESGVAEDGTHEPGYEGDPAPSNPPNEDDPDDEGLLPDGSVDPNQLP